MKKRILIALLSLFSLLCWGNDTIQDFAQGNELYRKGQFEKAIGVYERILDSGYEAPELYFNLGNAYYKSHRIPNAILNYEKARKLKPNDDEINFNLELARSRIVDKIHALPEFFLLTWYRSFVQLFPASEWADWSMISFALALLLAGIYLFSARINVRKIAFWLGALFLVVSTIDFAVSQQAMHRQVSHREAIVMSPTVTVRSSPDETGNELFILHEGTKVITGDSVGDWSEVQISDGNKGWLRSADLAAI